MMHVRILFAMGALVSLSACSSMSGLDAQSDFGCAAPEGVSCQSVSGVHANLTAGRLPFQQPTGEGAAGTKEGQEAGVADPEAMPTYRKSTTAEMNSVSPRFMSAPYSGLPIRRPPIVVRLWFAPFKSASGDLHDQKYVFTEVQGGEWLIEATQDEVSKQFRPVYPLQRSVSSSDEDSATRSHQQGAQFGVRGRER